MEPNSSSSPDLPTITTQRPLARPRRTSRGLWLRALLLTGVAIVVIAAIRPWSYWSAPSNAGIASQRNAVVIQPASEQPKEPASALSPGLQQLRESVALVEADGAAGREVLGSAFVVSSTGELVTALHVASKATTAVVRFHDGRVFDVAGYAALDPASDLALLQLRDPPPSLPAVQLARVEPQQLMPVIAWGHPKGITFSPFDGKVSRLLTTQELPRELQQFVRNLTSSEADQTWIQHTARLSEGNSGGPLANERGEVIGINSWIDRQTDYSYALPIGAVQSLLKQRFDEVQPLERYATSEARERDATWQSSAKKLREDADQARMIRWQVHQWKDYARLQRLAWGVTLANAPERFTRREAPGEGQEELVREADRVVAQLHEHRWNNGGQIIVINEFADQELSRPGAGVVFFGTVQRVVEGRQGERAMLVQLAGFDKTCLISLTGQLTAPEPGAQCLFLGVNDRGRTVRYGDNPLQPTVANVIIAPVMIPLK